MHSRTAGLVRKRAWLVCALGFVLMVACSDDTQDIAEAPTTMPDSPIAGQRSDPVEHEVETVASGLEAPWEIVFAPDNRMLVTERPGRIRVIENGQLRPAPLATVEGVEAQGESGLLGLALDPAFAENRRLYVYHTYAAGGGLRNRVVRYSLGQDGLRDRQVILDDIPGAGIHDGGRIAFGPDGKLYVTTGDAAQPQLAQDRNSLAGKILRIEGDGAIPADNPFPGSPVYAYGLRNPQGLAWQPGTNQLYATDHGPSAQDEIERIEPGANLGWPEARADRGYDGRYTAPVVHSGDGTWAPSGAVIPRTEVFPQWRGGLLFAGLRGAALWHLDLARDGARSAAQPQPVIEDTYGRLRTVAEGPDGALYLLTNNRDGRGSPDGQDDRVLRLRPRRG